LNNNLIGVIAKIWVLISVWSQFLKVIWKIGENFKTENKFRINRKRLIEKVRENLETENRSRTNWERLIEKVTEN